MTKYFLIADSGSTGTQWALVGGEKPAFITTPGLNPTILSDASIASSLRGQLSPLLPAVQAHGGTIDKVFFYGAGCGSPQNCGKIEVAIREELEASASFPSEIMVESDLLGAARALLGEREGVVAIMGTGSVAGHYTPQEATSPLFSWPALGYILGDEGSGAWLGKTLLAHVFKGQLSDQSTRIFHQTYPELTPSAAIAGIYGKGGPMPPNRYLASFAPFLSQHQEREDIREIVTEGIDAFIRRNLIPLMRERRLQHNTPTAFVGSIAYYFRDVLKETLSRFGLTSPARVLRSPIEALAAYHAKNA